MTGSDDGVGVVGILGPAYCGSTVLCYILNTDPHVFGGGELRRLVDENATVACDACGVACPYWTPENIRRFGGDSRGDGCEAFYQTIADITGARTVADASKRESFFSESFLSAEERSSRARFAFVLCVKHPIRLYASYIYNTLLPVTRRGVSNYAELAVEMGGILGREVREAFLPHVAQELSRIYGRLYERFLNRPERPCLVLKHEELAGPVGARAIVAFVEEGIGRRLAIDVQGFAGYEAHTTGGNRAPVWQSALARDAHFHVDDPRFGYYREHRGMRLDQKYLRIMPPNLIRRLAESRFTRELCELLGYSDDETWMVVEEGAPGI